jgi:hypothetical protein
MSAGSIQLVATGPQDVHITGNPQVSFFGTNYKRHTNFSMFRQRIFLQGTPYAGGRSTIQFERLGDLLGPCYLSLVENEQTKLIAEWSNVIKSCHLYIGGALIDSQDVEFTEDIAIDTFASNMSKSYPASLHGGRGSQSFFYPLRFFFCEHWGSAIPLSALSLHNVEVVIEWSDNFNNTYKPEFFATYISLDEAERTVVSQERNLLMFQVQKALPTNQLDIDLGFNHPVKYIASSNASALNYNNLVSRVNRVRVMANGVDLLDGEQVSVPHYTAIPAYYNTDFSYANAENMFLFPFCMNTAKLQPTGTLNFSRLDSFKVTCTQPINRAIYAVNYNILKIKKGLGALVFAN